MRRIFLVGAVLTLIVLLTGSTQAQLTFAVGPRIGFNLASTSLNQPINPGFTKGGRFGMIFGATTELGFDKGKMFFIVLEPIYVQKGFSIEGGGATTNYNFNYFNLPLYFKVKFLQGALRPYAFAGPDLGILLSATQSNAQGASNDWSDVIASDFSLDFGGGAEYQVAKKIWVIGDVRYMLGLKNVYSNPNQTTLEMTPSGFAILFGALFQI